MQTGTVIADPYDLEDAIFSAANYLAASGAADGEIEKAIFNYNHSEKYVEDVLTFLSFVRKPVRGNTSSFYKKNK